MYLKQRWYGRKMQTLFNSTHKWIIKSEKVMLDSFHYLEFVQNFVGRWKMKFLKALHETLYERNSCLLYSPFLLSQVNCKENEVNIQSYFWFQIQENMLKHLLHSPIGKVKLFLMSILFPSLWHYLTLSSIWCHWKMPLFNHET